MNDLYNYNIMSEKPRSRASLTMSVHQSLQVLIIGERERERERERESNFISLPNQSMIHVYLLEKTYGQMKRGITPPPPLKKK